MNGWLSRLDRKEFLGFDVWEFSWRSLARQYGRWFVWSVALRHPWRTWTGVRRYRRSARRKTDDKLTLVDTPSPEALCDAFSEGEFVVGTGFCQKPIDPPCPVGRFNHRCLALPRIHSPELPVPCRTCPVRELGLKALAAGGTMHIMTSAADIAQDLLVPSLRDTRWVGAVLAICPFSIPPFALAMSICGLRGLILAYNQGDCRDYATWIRADEGFKPEQTFLGQSAHERLIKFLGRVAQNQQAHGAPRPTTFREEGNFYPPSFEPQS